MNIEEQLQKVLVAPDKPAGNLGGERKKIVPVFILVFCLVLLGGLYFFKEWKGQNDIEIKSETQTLIEEVGKLISLPQDEEPTIATVSDPEVLKKQAFFANAKAGDKVLIYAKAKKAVLYDPVAKKIVEVAPLNIDNSLGKE